MALDSDLILDRRRLARRAAFWRGLAILSIVAALITAAVLQGGVIGNDHVARLPIRGAIVTDRPLLKLIERLEKNDSVKAILVTVNSPGGTSVGGERLYNALRELDAVKPVVVHITTLGASAAYMAALASDHIVAQRTSLTGSVGVLIQYGQVDKFLSDLGIEVGKVDSGTLKAEPNPFEPVQPEALALLQSVVDDTFDYFIGLVEERRGLTPEQRNVVADGRIFTGAQALQIGLIDAVGGEETAIDWLETERDVDEDLPVRDYKPDDSDGFGLTARITDRVVERVFAAFGVNLPAAIPTASVDGLWSVWQAQKPSDE